MPAANPDRPAPIMMVSYTALLLHDILHPRLQIRHGAGQAGEMLIILFRNLNAVPLAQLHHDVEKIHAVQLKLLAKWLLGNETRQVFIGRDIGQNIEDFLANFCGGHGTYFLMITTELIPSMPNELFKMC